MTAWSTRMANSPITSAMSWWVGGRGGVTLRKADAMAMPSAKPMGMRSSRRCPSTSRRTSTG
ncbi:MAG TPA: hypothetical protein VFA11_18040 [Acidimicrobiales bacterium]|nr:hypothetical protein [Acidimicrobiales bacterium]